MGSRGGRRAGVLACGVLLSALATGCAQAVPGTPHPEGEGPTTSTGSEVSPPTDFSEPSGRPTVTVQPDVTEPLIPGPLSTVPPTPSPAPTTTSAPAPDPGRRDAAPFAAGPTGSDRSRGVGGSDGSGSSAGAGEAGGPDEKPDPARSPAAVAPGAPVRSAPPAPAGPAPGPAAPAAPETTLLTADPIANECLLDAGGFAALLGGPVGKPAESAVVRPDGSSTRACYATSRAGDPAPTAAVNVYRVNQGTPASFVRAAAGGRRLPGVGRPAVLLDTVGGTTLQVATPTYLVTVNVVDAVPSTGRWAAAGRAVAAAAGRS